MKEPEPRIREKLDISRKELLDLSNRNRLLNTPRYKDRSRYVEIIDEVSEEIFRKLVLDRKSMFFIPAETESAKYGMDQLTLIEVDLPQLDEDENEYKNMLRKNKDKGLHTLVPLQKLQKKLLNIYYNARTYQEEQGVSILYLALGMLKWFESDSSDEEYHAPLLLIPVILERETTQSKFQISYDERDIATNLSLQARLKNDFGINFPEIDESDDLVPNDYYDKVEKCIGDQLKWEVKRNDIVLGFFFFRQIFDVP